MFYHRLRLGFVWDMNRGVLLSDGTTALKAEVGRTGLKRNVGRGR